MRSSLRAPILLVIALGACNGALRFDEQVADSSADVCTGCDWQRQACDAATCLLCAASTTCTGTCGEHCAATCQANSRCTLTTGEEHSLVCESGASCAFVVTQEGTLDCQPGSTCSISCPQGCSLNCQAGANCQIQCGTAPATTVVGSFACP